jgi:hypothetical protein
MARKKWMREVDGGRVFTIVPVKFNLDMGDVIGLLASHALSDPEEADPGAKNSERRLMAIVNDQLRYYGTDRTWTWPDGADEEDVDRAREWAVSQARSVWPLPFQLYEEAQRRPPLPGELTRASDPPDSPAASA